MYKRQRLFGAPSLDYAMVGRWIGHLPRGRLTHPGIARSAPVAGERAIGWIAHYAIGIGFALLLLAIWGPAWACLLYTSMCFVMMMVAIDQTVVGTALPTIVAELKGFELYAWVATSYLLTSVITCRLYTSPPFGQGWLPRLWPILPGILAEGGLVYVEAEDAIEPPEGFEILRQDKAGAVHYHLMEFAALRK